MRTPPLSVILGWPKANYEDPDTRGSALLITNLIFISLVLTAVVGRLYSRIVVNRWYGVDDTMMAFALLFTIGLNTSVILANRYYCWDRHVWDIPLDMLPSANIIAMVAKLMFTLASTFTRLSLICFYYRLVKDSGRMGYKKVLHASVAFVIAVCITFIFQTIFICMPVQAYWDVYLSETGHCLDEGTITLSAGIINCVADLLTTILPIPVIVKLQMPLKQRWGVCILLCLGFMVTIAGVVRTYYIWKSLVQSWDESWFSYPLWICATVEIDLAVICACAPAWKSLLQHPITLILSRLSLKISSLRSPHSSQRASSNTGRSLAFNPLRSLSWFQVTRLGFEKQDDRCDEASKCHLQSLDVEKNLISSPTQPCPATELGLGDENQQLASQTSQDTVGTTSPLQIIKRQSIEQNSAYASPHSGSERDTASGVRMPVLWSEPSK